VKRNVDDLLILAFQSSGAAVVIMAYLFCGGISSSNDRSMLDRSSVCMMP